MLKFWQWTKTTWKSLLDFRVLDMVRLTKNALGKAASFGLSLRTATSQLCWLKHAYIEKAWAFGITCYTREGLQNMYNLYVGSIFQFPIRSGPYVWPLYCFNLCTDILWLAFLISIFCAKVKSSCYFQHKKAALLTQKRNFDFKKIVPENLQAWGVQKMWANSKKKSFGGHW